MGLSPSIKGERNDLGGSVSQRHHGALVFRAELLDRAMVEALGNVRQQLLDVKANRTERLGSRRNTADGKRAPWEFRMGEGGE